VTTLYDVTDRLIGEHLHALLALGWQVDELLRTALAEPAATEDSAEPTTPFVRLISAARLLYHHHTIDTKGRCRICTRPSRGRRAPTRPCTVHAALSFYLLQPDELVLREIPRPAAPRLPRLRGDGGIDDRTR
jgi:hypothetical protein